MQVIRLSSNFLRFFHKNTLAYIIMKCTWPSFLDICYESRPTAWHFLLCPRRWHFLLCPRRLNVGNSLRKNYLYRENANSQSLLIRNGFRFWKNLSLTFDLESNLFCNLNFGGRLFWIIPRPFTHGINNTHTLSLTHSLSLSLKYGTLKFEVWRSYYPLEFYACIR